MTDCVEFCRPRPVGLPFVNAGDAFVVLLASAGVLCKGEDAVRAGAALLIFAFARVVLVILAKYQSYASTCLQPSFRGYIHVRRFD